MMICVFSHHREKIIMNDTPPPNSLHLSWNDIDRDSKALAKQLRGKAEWKGIIAVTRGGLVPSAIVANELNVRVVETICVASYDHQKQRKAELLKPVISAAADGRGWLVIDDLADTGRTLEIIRQILPQAHYATLYAKPQGKPFVDSFVTDVTQDTWIYFPWENNI